MHRSASDGYLRNSMPARESSLHSHDTGSGELRGRSGSGMQEEASYRQNPAQDHARGLLAAARMNETPDFAMIYAFLGSMFDPVSLLASVTCFLGVSATGSVIWRQLFLKHCLQAYYAFLSCLLSKHVNLKQGCSSH